MCKDCGLQIYMTVKLHKFLCVWDFIFDSLSWIRSWSNSSNPDFLFSCLGETWQTRSTVFYLSDKLNYFHSLITFSFTWLILYAMQVLIYAGKYVCSSSIWRKKRLWSWASWREGVVPWVSQINSSSIYRKYYQFSTGFSVSV